MTDSTPYFLTEAVLEVELLEVQAVDTVVLKVTDYPMAEMSAVFDSVFGPLFGLLETRGLKPIGPAFSLHHRMPTNTATFEVGIPVDKPLDAAVTTDDGTVLEPSSLPGGSIARVSYMGAYDGLGDAWGAFMYGISTTGKEPELPFWEMYVTEPSPEMDPATLRTDLISKVTN